MFDDYLFLGGLPASAKSFLIQCPDKTFLHPTPVCLGRPYNTFFTLRDGGACSPQDFKSGATDAEKNRDFFPPGRPASANGKEATPC